MKILFYGTRDYDRDSFTKVMDQYPEIEIEFTKTNLTWRTAILAKGYDAVCAFVNANIRDYMTVEILAGLGIKLILMRCAGFDAVNIPAAKELGIRVCNVPAYSPEAIAEHAMAIGQAANRRIHKGYNRVRENDFALDGLVGVTLKGKTAGIIGTGRIGAALCRICKGYGMYVIGADLGPVKALVDEGVVDEYVPVYNADGDMVYDEKGNCLIEGVGFGDRRVSYVPLYNRADFISLHAFLNADSYHMIDDEAISQMKDGVIFVNTGRGGLADTEAIIRGILSGKIGAAGLDVYEEENENVYQDRSSLIIDSVTARLCSFPNVVMTSHQAFFTQEALAEIAHVTLKNATAFATGAPDDEYVFRSIVC
ncbi:MAG: 2-hydroxyacid dehydrogenase [Atopobiaceae bacterium]|nr:2-hydroxyacid dehydrogenase [Atopobiaceae bacterium]